MKIEANARVVLGYELHDEDDDIVDASDAEDGAPIVYVQGYGMLVPGLERQLLGLAVGDKRDITVTAEEGFGGYDEDLVMEIDRADVPNPKEVAVGDELVAESADDEEAVMRVVDVTDDAVVLDGNHPLAGQTLVYKIEVLEVRAATEEEIRAAADSFDDAGYEPPAPAPEPLVSIGVNPASKKKKQDRKPKPN